MKKVFVFLTLCLFYNFTFLTAPKPKGLGFF